MTTEIGRIHRTGTMSIVIVVMIQEIETIINRENHQDAIRADQDIAAVEVGHHRTLVLKVILDIIIIIVTVEADHQATVRDTIAVEVGHQTIILRVTMTIIIDLIEPRSYLKQNVILVNTHKQSTVLYRMNRLVQVI